MSKTSKNKKTGKEGATFEKQNKLRVALSAFQARKIGIVARDYNVRFPNGFRDFSHAMPHVLAMLDRKKCDVALFSLYSIIPRKEYDMRTSLASCVNLRLVCLEEFQDRRRDRVPGEYVVYCRTPDGWEEYRFMQAFGRVNWQSQLEDVRMFARNEIPRRILGSCCLLLCGESNAVKYEAGVIRDPCGVLKALPSNVQVILNPVHDRMTRFEMMMKRRFLSEGGRWVVSVWNRGKRDKNGRTQDGVHPPWAVFHDGEAVPVERVAKFGIEIGMLDVAK